MEHLLDVAEAVFEEVGYDAATTNLIAARAEVPVGTLYRWFPDKAALAEALTDRYLTDLVRVYDDVVAELRPEDPIGDFVRRVMASLVSQTRHQRALPALLVSTMVPGGRSAAGRRLRSGLADHIRDLVEVRVPGIPADLRDRTVEVCVTLAHLVLTADASAGDDPEGRALAAEYVDVLLAYLDAKFPSAGDPAWTDQHASVAPAFPAPDRDARVAAERHPDRDAPDPT